MENNWYDHFLDTLSDRYPKKTQLIQALMDILYIEREAVYRRLRKDVIFSFQEIVKIASEWNISIDEIIGVSSGNIPFQMRQLDYLHPSEDETKFLQNIMQTFSSYEDSPDTEFMNICNKLPRQLFSGFEYLNKFYMFKWLYHYGNENDIVPFGQIDISKERFQLTSNYYRAIKHVPKTSFIWDRLLIDYLVSDILYFFSIQMITNEEKKFIKKDLHEFLDYMQEVANKGCYPETQKKVTLFISHLNIDTNYSYVFTPDANICFIHVFEKYEIYSFNSEIVKKFRLWMQLKKRSSIQISEVDELNRIEYFSRQRQLVDTL